MTDFERPGPLCLLLCLLPKHTTRGCNNACRQLTWAGTCSCLRNVVALFHVLEKEMAWRESVGKPVYGALNAYKPIVSVGAEHALLAEELVADYFRKLLRR